MDRTRITLYGSFTSSSSYKQMLYFSRWRACRMTSRPSKLNKGHTKLARVSGDQPLRPTLPVGAASAV